MSSATTGRAPERCAAMLQARREWARLAGLSEGAIEKRFCDSVAHFIEEGMRHWKKGEYQNA